MTITLQKISEALECKPVQVNRSDKTQSLEPVNEDLSGITVDGIGEAKGAIKKQTLIYLQQRRFLDDQVMEKGDFFLIDEKLRGSIKKFLPGKFYFFVKSARQFLIKILHLFDAHKQINPYQTLDPALIQKHQTQVGYNVLVGDQLTIGKNVIFMGNNSIGNNVTIGDNVIIHPNVSLGHETIIGNHVIIQAGTVIGSDSFGYENVDGKWIQVPGIGNVIIEDEVEIGCNSVIDRATISSTRIGKGTKIGNLVNIAHNVTIGRNCLLVGALAIAGSCEIGNEVIMAGQVGLINNIKIADRTIIGGQSGIITDQLKPGAKIFGSPSRSWKDNLAVEILLTKLLKQERQKSQTKK